MPVEQIGNALIAEAYYTSSGNVASGLTVTCDVDKLESDGTYTALVTGAAATEGRNGIYFYILASGSVDVKAVYNFVFKTADSCDQQDIVAAWTAGQAWVENVDAAISGIPDAILIRGASNIEDSADDTSLGALVLATFESKIDGTDWTIYKTDHSTVFDTRTLTLSGTAQPIVEVT